jgi:hypothetical protein
MMRLNNTQTDLPKKPERPSVVHINRMVCIMPLASGPSTCALVFNVSRGKATPTPIAPAKLPARTDAAAGPTRNALVLLEAPPRGIDIKLG